jgi:monoamine oxidase
MEKSDILIIGAGAAGLMAAYKLSGERSVNVLEARGRTGGRIHTIENELFFKHAELGAEFVHGDLPVTLGLLKEARITYSHAGGEMIRYRDGKFIKDEQFIEEWDLLLKKLNELKGDISIHDFLQLRFGDDKYTALRASVEKYVAGYDSADPRKASAFALRKEWENEDDEAQHRIDKGYCTMIKYLANKIKANGGNIYLNSVVKEIDWKQGDVKVVTTTGAIYSAEKVIIALPLGVLQADRHEEGAVTFHPAIKKQSDAIKHMGFGAIIKVLLEFDKPFWKDAGAGLKDMAFLFSDEAIPTWWTQAPKHSPLLTGWLGGPPAERNKETSNEELLQMSLGSLGNIFKLIMEELKTKLIAWNIVNWTAEPFTRGSYSYDTIAAPQARKLLNEAVEDTLFFAGEYLFDGPAMGTVEAALTSGKEVAERILDQGI